MWSATGPSKLKEIYMRVHMSTTQGHLKLHFPERSLYLENHFCYSRLVIYDLFTFESSLKSPKSPA